MKMEYQLLAATCAFYFLVSDKWFFHNFVCGKSRIFLRLGRTLVVIMLMSKEWGSVVACVCACGVHVCVSGELRLFKPETSFFFKFRASQLSFSHQRQRIRETFYLHSQGWCPPLMAFYYFVLFQVFLLKLQVSLALHYSKIYSVLCQENPTMLSSVFLKCILRVTVLTTEGSLLLRPAVRGSQMPLFAVRWTPALNKRKTRFLIVKCTLTCK